MYTIKFIEGERSICAFAESDLDLVQCGKNDPWCARPSSWPSPDPGTGPGRDEQLEHHRDGSLPPAAERRTSRWGRPPSCASTSSAVQQSFTWPSTTAGVVAGRTAGGDGMMIDYGFNMLNLNRIQLTSAARTSMPFPPIKRRATLLRARCGRRCIITTAMLISM